MNKNLLLVLLAGGALIVFTMVVFSSPESNTFQSKDSKHSTSPTSSHLVKIQIKNLSTSSHSSQKEKSKNNKATKKIDPTIKVSTTDYHNNYLIQLINENAKNTDESTQINSYRYIKGTISGKAFTMKVPLSVLTHSNPNFKIKITKLSTNQSKTIEANFLTELLSTSREEVMKIDFDFQHLNSVKSEIILPNKNVLFPGD